MNKRSNFISLLCLMLFLVAAYFPLFLHLDALSLRLWDEARRAVNALEMMENGQWLVPHFNGAPDQWGTKPPLLIWLQAALMKILGPGELAVRLPSALASLLTAFILIFTARRIWGSSLAGYLAALVLLTSDIYIGSHGAISGDYDALLSLWSCGMAFAFYLFLQEKQGQWLWLTAGLLVLGGWTKGIAAFFFLPAMLLYTLVIPSARWVWRDLRVYAAGAAALSAVLLYYVMREAIDPGYWQLVWDNEVGGRFLQAKEGHGRRFWFYFRVWYQYDLFYPWLFFLPLSIWLSWRDKATHPFTRYLLVCSLVFLLIISSAATKLIWYSLPVIPLLSLLVGSGLQYLYKSILQLLPGRSQITLALFIIALFTAPYVSIIDKVYHLQHKGPERSKMLYRDLLRYRPHQDEPILVILPGYNAHFTFYERLAQYRGDDVKGIFLTQPDPQVHPAADTFLRLYPGLLTGICEQPAGDHLDRIADSDVLWEWESCKLVRIINTK